MIRTGRIAVPSNLPGGLKGERSQHFGHCELFTIIELRDGQVEDVSSVANAEHGAGGCMVPVHLLHEKKIDAVVVAGLGGGPLRGFNNVGIKVFRADCEKYPHVESVVEALVAAQLPLMAMDEACRGNGGCHHSH